MNLFRSTTTTLIARNSMNYSPLRRAFLLIPLVLAFFALSPTARPQLSPAPDGGYPNANTAEGANALLSLTTGVGIGDRMGAHRKLDRCRVYLCEAALRIRAWSAQPLASSGG